MAAAKSFLTKIKTRLAEAKEALPDYFNVGSKWRQKVIEDREALEYFLNARASYVAQMSLYGYLRTRAGQRYPILFENDAYVASINIAKWHMWLACLSDISVYAGGMLAQDQPQENEKVRSLMLTCLENVFAEIGIPEETDGEFPEHRERLLTRLRNIDFTQVADGEAPFSESPPALVHYAPIIKALKELDEEIVINSVRFRWQEVRRDLRKNLKAELVLASKGV